MKFFSKDYFFAALLVFSLLWVLLPVLTNVDFIDPIQNALEDVNLTDIVFSRMRDNESVTKDTNIVLVNIGRLSRAGIAKQISNIMKFQPKVLGIDSFFRTPKDSITDEILANELHQSRNIVLVSELKNLNNETMTFDSLVKSISKFSEGVRSGFANLHIDADAFRTCRQVAIAEKANNKNEYSFPAKVLSIYAPDKFKKLMDRNNDFEIINYRRNIDKYTIIDAEESLSDTADFSFIKGKIVLLGFLGIDTSRQCTEDIYFSPLNERFVGKAIPDMYGVVIHANVLSQFIDEDYINSLNNTYIIILFLFLVYLNIMLFYNLENKFPHIYEPLSILIPMSQVFVLIIIALSAFYFFNFVIKIEKIIFAIFFCSPGYELYNGSIKQLARKVFSKWRAK